MALSGRPTDYDESLIEKVDEYLETCTDSLGKEVPIVNLPMIEGFAKYVGFSKSSIYVWREKYPLFMDALEKITDEQKMRLINNGLAGNYASVTNKLMLSCNHGMIERKDVTLDDRTVVTRTRKRFDGSQPEEPDE